MTDASGARWQSPAAVIPIAAAGLVAAAGGGYSLDSPPRAAIIIYALRSSAPERH
jgi:hypothetical protein